MCYGAQKAQLTSSVTSVANAISVELFAPLNIVNNFSNIDVFANAFGFVEFHVFTVVPEDFGLGGLADGNTLRVDRRPDEDKALRFWNRPMVPLAELADVGAALSGTSEPACWRRSCWMSISLKPMRLDFTVMLRWVLSRRMSKARDRETCLKLWPLTSIIWKFLA